MLLFPKNFDRFGLKKMKFPPGAELEHTLIPATTGSGKSQLIHLLMNRIFYGIDTKPDLEKAIVTDPGGLFLSTRGLAGTDTILNPADKRSAKWNPFSEVRDPMDFGMISAAAIPTGGYIGQEKDFREYARGMLEAIMRSMHQNGQKNPREVQLLLSAPDPEILRPYIEGTPAGSLLGPGQDRFLGGVIGTASHALAAWQWLSPDGTFSIRDWVKNGRGALFLTYTDDKIEAFRPVLGAWISLAIKETLSLPPDLDKKGTSRRRVWFVTDELDSLGTVNGLSDALTRGRKYGLCSIGAIQSISQLRERYGRDGAQTLLACYVNKLVMRQGAFEDAKYWSDELGQQEAERVTRSHSASMGTRTGGTEGSSSAPAVRQLFLPSELVEMPKFCGYARISGRPGIRPFQFRPRSWKTKYPPFEAKE